MYQLSWRRAVTFSKPDHCCFVTADTVVAKICMPARKATWVRESRAVRGVFDDIRVSFCLTCTGTLCETWAFEPLLDCSIFAVSGPNHSKVSISCFECPVTCCVAEQQIACFAASSQTIPVAMKR